MAKVINITPDKDWRNSPVMQDLIAKDKARAEKAIKKYNQKTKKII